MPLVDVYRYASRRLRRVGMEQSAGCLTMGRYFADGLQHTDFVVGSHHRHDERALVEYLVEVGEVQEAVGSDGQHDGVKA